MAMLAEPRRRNRYNLQPRGKPLYEDESRFGTRMLEKMGWKKGQGLGANEGGSKDFVRIRYKNDSLGLGFAERDDQWTQHEENFNGLLENLNNEKNNRDLSSSKDSEHEMRPPIGLGFQIPTSEKLKEKISGISLEERSKHSKARVHYKKFTKGKDLAQYSEKDLANIFGKKAVVGQHGENDVFVNLNNMFKKQHENSGVQMINTGVSINDYFRKKLESSKTLELVANNSISIENDSEENIVKKKKKKKNSHCEEEEKVEKESSPKIIYSNVSVNDYFKIKMDAIKNRKGITNQKGMGNEDSFDVALEEGVGKKNKKSKKCVEHVKNAVTEETKAMEEDGTFICIHREGYASNEAKTDQVKKKSKKTKTIANDQKNDTIKKECRTIDNISNQETEAHAEEPGNQPLKKKSKKQKNISFEEDKDDSVNQVKATLEVTNQSVNKKSKKNKDISLDQKNETNEIKTKAEITMQPEPIKKKSKKTTIITSIVDNETTDQLKTYEETRTKILNVKEIEELYITADKKKTDDIKKIENDSTKYASDTKKRKLFGAQQENTASSSTIEPTCEIETPKKKRNKVKDEGEIIVLDDSDESFENSPIIQEERKKKKSKSNKGTTTRTKSTENVITVNVLDDPSEKLLEEKLYVNCNAKKAIISDFKLLDIEEMKEQCKAFNTYSISSFCAEKFRNINLNDFTGSSLPQIEGYGLSPDLQLNIHINPNDEQRITNLWKGILNKYDQQPGMKKTYHHYVREFINARRTKQKLPKFCIKSWKRKNAFQAI